MNLSPVVDKRMHVEIYEGLAPKDTLFIHGNLASSRWWHPTLRVFRTRQRGPMPGALIFADWWGCGRTPAPRSAADMSMERLAQDYLDLLAELRRPLAERTVGLDSRFRLTGPVDVVGHSTGGLIALLAMRRSPESFHRAVLLDSVGAKGTALGPGMRVAFQRMTCDRAFAGGLIAATIHGPASHLPFVSVELGDDAFSAAKAIGTWVLEALEGLDYEDDVRAIPHPTLVLHGEHDTLLPKDDSRRLAELLPKGSFMELAGHGHCANVEDPEGFVRIAEGFLYS